MTRALALVIALGMAWPASAAPAGKPRRVAAVAQPALRGPPPAAPPSEPDPSVMPPSLVQPVAPRVGGLADAPGGGSECRTLCVEQRYGCIAVDDADQCAANWSQCVAACPANSASSD